MDNWQPVFKDSQEHRTLIIKDVLENNGLQAIIVNKKISAYGFGNFELLVPPDHVIRALKIIKEEIKFE